MAKIVFAAFNSFGTPYSGLTPSWSACYRASDGLVIGVPPTFTDLGEGQYSFDTPVGTDIVGIIQLTSLAPHAVPKYLFFQAEQTVVGFAAYNALDGEPLAGLVPIWVPGSLVAVATGLPYPDMPFVEYGNGVYRTLLAPIAVTGIIDLGLTATPRYLHYDSTRESAMSNIFIISQDI